MSDLGWESHPFAIHLAMSDSAAALLERSARRAGASVIRLDLSGLCDREELAERLSQVFMFPHETKGLDAAVDLIWDLEWFGASEGYVVMVSGIARSAENVLTIFAEMLPPIIDRWRTQQRAFVVAFVGDAQRRATKSALAKANIEMLEAGALPWAQPGTGPVAIVDHGVPEDSPVT